MLTSVANAHVYSNYTVLGLSRGADRIIRVGMAYRLMQPPFGGQSFVMYRKLQEDAKLLYHAIKENCRRIIGASNVRSRLYTKTITGRLRKCR